MPGWEQRFRAVIAEVRRDVPCCGICFDELLVARVREIVADRAIGFELDARERAAEAYAAGRADERAEHCRLSLVRG